MKTARAFGARRMPSATLMPYWSTGTGANLRARRDERKTGQRVTRIFDPDFLVRPLHDTGNDIDGLLRARSDYDLFGLAPHRTCGLKIVSNGLAQFQHAAAGRHSRGDVAQRTAACAR